MDMLLKYLEFLNQTLAKTETELPLNKVPGLLYHELLHFMYQEEIPWEELNIKKELYNPPDSHHDYGHKQ
jgi:hypothetical protein